MPALSLLTALAVLPPVRTEAMPEAAMAPVVVVRSADAQHRCLGSAFLRGDGAVAVTNAHVAGAAAEVRLPNAAGRTETARVIARDAVRDVAVLSVTPGRQGVGPGPGAW